jgi:hypothetical protein
MRGRTLTEARQRHLRLDLSPSFCSPLAGRPYLTAHDQTSRHLDDILHASHQGPACLHLSSAVHWSYKMPPKRTHNPDEAHTSLKDKLQNLQGSNARGGRRNGAAGAVNGSGLKEVDNASTNSGHTSVDLSSSGNVRCASFPISLHASPWLC